MNPSEIFPSDARPRARALQAQAKAQALACGACLTGWRRRAVLDHIEGNLDGDVTCGRLADVAGLSKSYFARVFKGALGEAPRAYIIRRRVARAMALMVETSQPLSEIAVAAGFSDQSHLTRRFHLIVGQTPSAWRRAQGIAPDRRLAA